jgi:hypothetical protein
MNDLWAFTIGSRTWSFISGETTFNSNGSYGTLGVTDPANLPGAIAHSSAFSNGYALYYVAGCGYATVNLGGPWNVMMKLSPCDSTSYFNGSGCSSCAVGKHIRSGMGSDVSNCTVSGCGAGFVFDSGLSKCAACQAGKFAAVDEVSCSNCPAGQYSGSSGASSCTQCPVGTYSSSTGASICTSCSAGKWTYSLNSTICTDCVAGKYWKNSSIGCTDCPDGTYNNQAGQTSSGACATCTAGSFSSAGSSVCGDCPAGTYPSGGANCQACSAGTYAQFSKSPACTLCSAGKFGNTTGLSSCPFCPAGKFSSENSSFCSNCLVGTYSPTNGSASCILCPAGLYSDSPGFSACSSCLAGSFSSYGYTNCTTCPEGTYSPDDGSVKCINCPAGSWSPEPGSSVCTTCEAGTYQSSNASTSCTECAAGRFSFASNSVSCALCSAGTISSQNGSTSCSVCPIGKYSEAGASSCSSCAEFATTFTAGSPSIRSCFCQEGHYGSAFKSNGICKLCTGNNIGVACSSNASFPIVQAGYFRSLQDPSSALICSPASACPETGEAAQTSCADGYTGSVCGDCILFYSFRQGLVCTKCPSPASRAVTYVAIFTILLLVLYRFIKKNFNISQESRIALLWIQIIATYPSISSSWPKQLLGFFSFLSFSNLDIAVFSPECSIPLTFWSKYWLKMCLPLISTGALAFIQLVIFFIKRARGSIQPLREELRQIYVRTKNLFGFITLAFFTTIVSSALSPFVCISQPDGTYNLAASPNILCFGDEWRSHLSVIVIFIIGYLVIYPTYLFLILAGMEKDRFKSVFGTSRELKTHYQWLIKSYRDNLYWWEVIHVMKRTSIILCASFASVYGSPSSKYYISMLILVVFLLSEVVALPYKRALLNKISLL